MPNLRIFEYKEVTNTPQNTVIAPNLDENVLHDKFVTREEYEGLKRQYESIMERLDSMVSDDEPIEPIAKPKSKRGGNASNEQSDI
jgi:hypothetical protein